jgi:hypothetical protein
MESQFELQAAEERARELSRELEEVREASKLEVTLKKNWKSYVRRLHHFEIPKVNS